MQFRAGFGAPAERGCDAWQPGRKHPKRSDAGMTAGKPVRRVRETLPVHLQDELPRDRGPRAPGGRRLPQPRLREHPQDLPDTGLQDHARPLRHGPDDVHQIHHRGGRRRGRSQHQRSPLPPLRQHRPATRQHLHQRPVRRARPRHQRNRQRQQAGVLPLAGGALAGSVAARLPDRAAISSGMGEGGARWDGTSGADAMPQAWSRVDAAGDGGVASKPKTQACLPMG